ncbi:hypothetical protein [Novosphingobium sp. ST904]|uniref:hypothetical protein n=1 Tax=Novosphingobium sp. ST904 TaxID=1684385 RepID=UPI0010F12E2D|nr:hypothetical protein [Novosphingobium sp. ST904]TCM41449.1 hypothetical protein EDF59_103201 [Novosphingobium sp. ST904]
MTLDGTWRGSRLRDPVTGRNRVMDDISPRSITAEFRHDVPAFKSSWGVNWTAAVHGDVFYTGEVLRWRDHALWGAYVETTAIAGFKTTLTVKAINGQDFSRLRRFYSPSRAGSFSGSEQRAQREGAIVSLSLARSL